MNRNAAITQIKSVFAAYRQVRPADAALLRGLKNGKLYELFVLSELIKDLSLRGFGITFIGTTLKFKGGHGKIKLADPHFEVSNPQSKSTDWRIFVDIEFETLGHQHNGGPCDKSCRHELDVVVTKATIGYPLYSEIGLGIECKAVAHFEKELIKEVLGVRRELSLLTQPPQPSSLTTSGGVPPTFVPANPPSEFWLAFIDGRGSSYSKSPSAFGIELRHLRP